MEERIKTIKKNKKLNDFQPHFFKFIRDSVQYFLKSPTRSFIFLLLVSRIVQISTDSVKKTPDNSPFNDIVNIYDVVAKNMSDAILLDHFDEVNNTINQFLKIHSKDEYLLQEKLRIYLYDAFEHFDSMQNEPPRADFMKKITPIAEEVLSVNSENVLANSALMLRNYVTHNNVDVYAKKMMNAETEDAFVHCCKASYYIHLFEHHKNPKLLLDAITELDIALKEKHVRTREIFDIIKTTTQEKYDLENKKIDTSIVKDFSDPQSTYKIPLRSQASRDFHQIQDSHFESHNIREAAANHFALVFKNTARFPETDMSTFDHFNEFSRPTLLYKSDSYYLYSATVTKGYELVLTPVNKNVISKNKISDQFLKSHVSVIVTPSGEILSDDFSLQKKLFEKKSKVHLNVKVKNPHQKNQEISIESPSGFFSHALGGTIIMSIITYIAIRIIKNRNFNFLKRNQGRNTHNSDQNEMTVLSNDELVSYLNELCKPLSEKYFWSLKDKQIIADISLVNSKFSIEYLRKDYNYNFISVNNEKVLKLLFRKLQPIFGKESLKINDQSLILMPNINLLPPGNILKNLLGKMISELMKNLIEQSPEYKVNALLNLIKATNRKLITMNASYFEKLQKDIVQIESIRKKTVGHRNNYVNNKGIVDSADDIIKDCNILIDLNSNQRHPIKIDFVNLHLLMDEYQIELESLNDQISSYDNDLELIQKVENNYLKTKKSVDLLCEEFLNFDKKYTNLYDSYQSLSIHIERLIKKFSDPKPVIAKNPKAEGEKTPKIVETPEQKTKRVAEHKIKKAKEKEEREKGKQEEEEAIQKKNKSKENVAAMVEKSNEIERLKADTRLSTLKHHLEILSSGIQLNRNPQIHPLISKCSGSSIFEKIIKEKYFVIYSYYAFQVALLRTSHCLGQMVGAYSQHYLVHFPSYSVRDVLMHFFFKKELNNFSQLVEASEEFIAIFGSLIKKLRQEGFPEKCQELKFESLLFQENILKAYKERKFDRPEVIYYIKLIFNHIEAINELTVYLHDKHLEFYLSDKCVFLHQSVVGCFTMLGEMLNKLDKVDKFTSKKLFKLMKDNDLTYIVKGKHVSYFKIMREQIGHHYLEKEEKNNILFPLNYIEYEILNDFKPVLLTHLCKKIVTLSDKVAQLLKSDLVRKSEFGVVPKKERGNDDDEEKKPSMSQ